MFKDFEDFKATGKDSAEAMVASATAWTQGLQSVASEVSESTTKAFDVSKSVAEKTASAKTVEKAIEIQTKYARDSMDAYWDGMNRIGEIYFKAAVSAFKPLEVQAAKVGAKVNAKASA